MKKDSFNKHLRDYMFYSAEVGSSVKNQVQCRKTNVFLQNSIDTFVSNTVWYLIQNNNHLSYHKELMEKQVQLYWTLEFKSQRYRVGYQSNKKLYKLSAQFINSKYGRF